jgi:hypothetical protein
MDLQRLSHPQCAVGSFRYQYQLDVVNLGELQNLDELNRDADLTCQVAAHQLHQLVGQVDEERLPLRMDYFLGAVDVELRHLKRMDCFLDAALALLALALLEFRQREQLNLFQQQLVAQYCFRQSRALVQP